MATISSTLTTELKDVQTHLAAVAETEHSGLSDFIRREIEERGDSLLVRTVLAAGLPARDTPAARDRRVHLAAALELLAVALSIHKLLLLSPDLGAQMDKSLVGGTVLAGDYCFSQAAVLAARTENPQVVAIFSELLRDLSELHLRQAFGSLAEPFDERAALLESGARAAALLAELPTAQQEATALFAGQLAHLPGEKNEALASRLLQDAGLASHQVPRWMEILGGREGDWRVEIG